MGRIKSVKEALCEVAPGALRYAGHIGDIHSCRQVHPIVPGIVLPMREAVRGDLIQSAGRLIVCEGE